MINYNNYIGKSICINRDNYPVYFFNVQEYDSNTKELVAEQIIDSPNSDDLEVYCEGSYDVDPKHDVVSLVTDTPEELFADVVKYLKEQIENCSGLQLS